MNLFGPDSNSRVRRGSSIEWNLVDGKAILVHIEEGMVLKLDDVGTAVWLAIDGTKKVTDLVRHICGEYDVSEQAAKKDILGLLGHLKANEAIEYI